MTFKPFKLVAVERTDGMLFFEHESRVYVCREPYEFHIPVQESAVARAVGDHGFEAMSSSFKTFEDLIAFVKSTVSPTSGMTRIEVAEGLLRVAPPNVLTDFLDRAERELLPKEAYDAVERLTSRMLAHSLHLSPQLEARALSLRTLAQASRKQTGTKFSAVLAEIEAEARAEGPAALKELDDLRDYFRHRRMQFVQKAAAQMTPEYEADIRAWLADPEAHGGLSWLQDCGQEVISKLLTEIDRLRTKQERIR